MPPEVDTWLSSLDREQMYAVACTPCDELQAFFKGYTEIPGLPLPSHLQRRNEKVQALLATDRERRQRERTDVLIQMISDPEADDAEYRYAGV